MILFKILKRNLITSKQKFNKLSKIINMLNKMMKILKKFI